MIQIFSNSPEDELVKFLKDTNNYNITEDLSTTPCHYTADGYCLRDEGDYCQDGTCICPHLITEINVIATCVTCETTVEVCECCKKRVTEPKMDC
jgi:hypothetical protein